MNTIKKTSDIISPERACGLADEAAHISSGYHRKGIPTCQPAAKANQGKDEHRKPGKRNGCIGNWLEQMAKVDRKTLGSTGSECHFGRS